MYGLVPYNISPIQQGIQFGHAVVEYGLENFEEFDYQQWASVDKTFIILNGGTTNTSLDTPGTLNEHRQELNDNWINFSSFFEPDLGDQLTAVVFLVDDRVYDKKAFPDYAGPRNLMNGEPESRAYFEWLKQFSDDESEALRLVWLRHFLSQFRLA